mmetsp:Transcript_13079/g.41250  ORF Transcript_13079/g.41250 Transcript_13079/m.41250 type:complete len:289 (-) Transcript_13079:720-1586(-)
MSIPFVLGTLGYILNSSGTTSTLLLPVALWYLRARGRSRLTSLTGLPAPLLSLLPLPSSLTLLPTEIALVLVGSADLALHLSTPLAKTSGMLATKLAAGSWAILLAAPSTSPAITGRSGTSGGETAEVDGILDNWLVVESDEGSDSEVDGWTLVPADAAEEAAADSERARRARPQRILDASEAESALDSLAADSRSVYLVDLTTGERVADLSGSPALTRSLLGDLSHTASAHQSVYVSLPEDLLTESSLADSMRASSLSQGGSFGEGVAIDGSADSLSPEQANGTALL